MLSAASLFVLATVAVVLAGPRMARTADDLARATGMGGALFGVVFLSIATDLPEVALVPTAVLGGSPRLAVGGLLGSAAAQLVLIAAVDMAFRTGKLARLVPLRTSVGQGALMAAVLAVPLILATGGQAWGGIGLGTLVLPATYLGVLAAIRRIEGDDADASPSMLDEPIRGADPEDAGEDEDDDGNVDVRASWLRFGGFAVVLAGAGVALESSTKAIGSEIGLGDFAAGALLAGVVTSLPELVTAASAARAGALDLAVGDLVGSSALDVTLLALADAFYTDGSIFELLGRAEVALVGVSLALTALLLVGLARREPVGSPRVGIESYLMLAVYAGGAAVILTSGG